MRKSNKEKKEGKIKMKIIKKKSEKTYTNKKGKECHYYNYYIELDNGKRIQVKASFVDETKLLDMVAIYEK